MVLVTAQETMTAALAALNAALPAQVRAYDLHKVPSPRPDEYVTVLLMRRPGAPLSIAGTAGVVGYRIRVRAASHTSVTNVRNLLERCRGALEFARIQVGATRTTPIQFETEDDVTGDDGWFAAYDDYTFAL